MGELRFVPLSEYRTDCRLLEVEPGASLEEIKQAYHDQTKVWHPDRFSNDVRLQKKAEEKIVQINLAYRRLCGLSRYEHPVLSTAASEASSDCSNFFALRRTLRNSVTVASKPFVWLAFDANTGVFRWCGRERRSLAIAATAFVLGLAFGVLLLPRMSETWVKINRLRQTIIETDGTTEAAVTEPSPAVLTTTPPSLGGTSSLQKEVSLSSWSFGTTSHRFVTDAAVDVFAAETNIATTFLSIGEEQAIGMNSTRPESDWLKSFGDVPHPERTGRSNYMPISFVPRQNTFYCALPKNDIEHGQFRPAALNLVPWLKHIHTEPGWVIAQQEREESLWKPSAHPAAPDPSHVGTQPDENVMSIPATTGENEVAEREKAANQAPSKPRQGRRGPTDSVIAGSAAKAVTIYSPRPNYPGEARSHHIAGSGVCVVSIDPASGSVTDASMAQSTGSLLLDKSVLRTLRTWKFKPGTVSRASVPIEFTREGENP